MYVCTERTYPSRLADACDNPACLADPRLSEARKAGMRAAAEAAARRRAEDEARLAARAALRRRGFTTAF